MKSIVRLQQRQLQRIRLSQRQIDEPIGIAIGIPTTSASIASLSSPTSSNETADASTTTITTTNSPQPHTTTPLQSTTSSLNHFMVSSTNLRIQQQQRNSKLKIPLTKSNYHSMDIARSRPICHGLHNIALAHILITHLLLWLMDLNSIDFLHERQFNAHSIIYNNRDEQQQQQQVTSTGNNDNNHKVIYAINYPPPPKTTASRSLSVGIEHQNKPNIANNNGMPTTTIPIISMNQNNMDLAITTKQSDHKNPFNSFKTNDRNLPIWPTMAPPDEQFTKQNMLLIPITTTANIPTTIHSTTPPFKPTSPLTSTTTTTSSTTSTTTTSTTTSTPAPPPIRNQVNDENEEKINSDNVDDNHNDKNKLSHDNFAINNNDSNKSKRFYNQQQRLPPAPEQVNQDNGDRDEPVNMGVQAVVNANNAINTLNHQLRVNQAIATTPPSPINWADSASEQAPKHELGDSGNLSQLLLPARKRRVQTDSNGIHHWPPPMNSNPISSTSKNPEHIGEKMTSGAPSRPPIVSTSPSPAPTKRKTAFKPIMTSRHINLTTNKSDQLLKPTLNNHLNVPNDQFLDKSNRNRSPKAVSNSKVPSDIPARPFPSLETSEPAAWPTTVGTRSTDELSHNKLQRQQQQNKPKLTQSNATKKPLINANANSKEKFEIDEISQVIPVLRARKNRDQKPGSNREQRAMMQQKQHQQDVEQLEDISEPIAISTTTSSPLEANNETIENQSDKSPSTSEPETADSLDSQLPPVPNYANMENDYNSDAGSNANNSSDYTTVPMANEEESADSMGGNDIGESDGDSDNEEQLQQQLQGQVRIESRRINSAKMPQSLPLVYTNNNARNLMVNNSSENDHHYYHSLDNNSRLAIIEYLRCIGDQFYILIAAILLNLWLDGLINHANANANANNEKQHQHRVNSKQLINNLSSQLEPQYAKVNKLLLAKRRQIFETTTTTSAANSMASLDNLLATNGQSTHRQQQQQARLILQLVRHNQIRISPSQLETCLLLAYNNDSQQYCNKKQQFENLADSGCQAHLTACSLFAGLCTVAGAIAAIAINLELVTILTQCLIQFSTILACLIGLCFIWQENRMRNANVALAAITSRDLVPPIVPNGNRHRRLWQHKNALYLEPTNAQFCSRFASIREPMRQITSKIPATNSLTTTTTKQLPSTTTFSASGRQFFHYLFLLAAYYMGVSITLNLGSQYTMQQVFPRQIIHLITSYKQTNGDLNSPIALSYFNSLFHCVLALKGSLLILQVTIQTILIRYSCKTKYQTNHQSRLRHIYTFLMFANLSLWAIEIIYTQSKHHYQQTSSQAFPLIQAQIPGISSTSSHQTTAHNPPQPILSQNLMSLDAFINFASSIVTLSHLYHGLIFM